MTREEAIARIKEHKIAHKMNEQRAILISEALDIAIKALEHPERNVVAIVPCGDAISRQALLDNFGLSEKTRKWGGDNSGYNTMMLYEIQDMIESAPSIKPQEPKWIPISERLPEKDMFCLVSVGLFHITKMAIYSDLMKTIDHKIFYTGDYGHANFADITEYVEAWMPLPAPYKAEREDKE